MLNLKTKFSDQELIDLNRAILQKLAQNGSKDFRMTIPAQETDSDILYNDLITRFQEIVDKPKPGDMCYFWDDQPECAICDVLEFVQDDKRNPFMSYKFGSWKNCSLTKPESNAPGESK